MADDNDGTGGGEGGGDPGDGRRDWPEGYRVAFAELERDTMVSVAEMKSYAAESKAAIAGLETRAAEREARAAEREARAAERENRQLKWMVALAVGGTTVLGVLIAFIGFIALFVRGG